jgi:serine phosphatase RsbU (regulator of sigma subunit)
MRHTLRATVLATGSVAEALSMLNRDLISRPELSLGTAVCVRLYNDSEQAQVYSAGHPLPMLLGAGHCTAVGEFGPMLGAFADAQWHPVSVAVTPGDILVLYSDGVTDTVGSHARFGEQRLEEALTAASTAADAVAGIRRALADFQVGAQADDVAVLAVQRTRGAVLTGAPSSRTEDGVA